MEGSFRLFLTLSTAVGFYAGHLPGRTGPHTALPLRVWNRQGTVDPVSQPFPVLPHREGYGGPTKKRLPSLQTSSIHRGTLGLSPSCTPYPKPGHHSSASIFVHLPVLDISYKRTHKMCPFVFASLTDHRVFKVHPRCSLCQNFTPFHGEAYTTVCMGHMLLTHPSIYRPTHPPIHSSIHLTTHTSTHPSINKSTIHHPSIHPLTNPSSTHTPIHPSTHPPSIHPCIHLSIHPSIHSSVTSSNQIIL